jgi:hypothetical protein
MDAVRSLVIPGHVLMQLLDLRYFSLLALLLTGCVVAPSLESSRQSEAATQRVESSDQYIDACLISLTGANRNGQQLSQTVVKAIQAELSDRQVDCGGPVTAAIPASQALGPSQIH